MITYKGQPYAHAPGETILTCLERHGVQIPSFCRSGVCQSCLVKLTDGTPPAKSQVGLKDTWKHQGLVLACVCEITEPMAVEPSDATRTYTSRIVSSERLSANVLRVLAERPAEFAFEAGQFVQLGRPLDGVARPYSIASLPRDEHLEFHVSVYADGELSPWFASAVGMPLSITGPFGECVYLPDDVSRPLILAGTGTGLAPLIGVLRAALAAGHEGPIALYHGARTAEELYYWRQFGELGLPSRVSVHGVHLEGELCDTPGITKGDLIPLLLGEHPKPDTARVYLCGNPTFVQTLKKRLYLAGASLTRIHSDPFLPKATKN